ncbi:hypothetical protein N7499_003091 [Penicillium canescens]|uniref:Uncharacterized protein n=2 Tax=Penicillium canescens TaxID=5083 RepID=A0AAD6IAM1_PENCN|nr:hypothetical protein N7522_000517 [Penicillium canescens]KAJ6039102.1 hypothetical protein N7460_007134 [Penicillium canescens]KAJ6059881.1 hypothetical protein N7444_003520 [Penicillium canescens]KAJ6093760.1 hypothetical protein N7499_003091 [Penicillium canescens]KAJ6174446.1 hypothetical protein N7485_005512 [Penicillium canescens]
MAQENRRGSLYSHVLERTAIVNPQTLLEYLLACYPILLMLLFVVVCVSRFIANSKAEQKRSQNKDGQLPRRTWNPMASGQTKPFSGTVKHYFIWLSAGVLVTFLVDATVHITHVLMACSEYRWRGQSVIIYIVGSIFAYAVILVSIVDTTPSPTATQLTCWSFAVLVELIIFTTTLSLYTSVYHEPAVGNPSGGPIHQGITFWGCMELVPNGVRILILITLVLLYSIKSGAPIGHDENLEEEPGHAVEATGLLKSPRTKGCRGNGPGYGSTGGAARPAEPKPPRSWVRPEELPSISFFDYLGGFSRFFPYMWPSKSPRLQVVAVACFVLVILQRIVNVMTPVQIGAITTVLADQQAGKTFYTPWFEVCMYVFCLWLQEVLGSLRTGLWIPMGQYSYLELSAAVFEHVHSLSLDFHLEKQTGELLSALNKGKSVNSFLEQVTFQFLPTLADLLIAIGYFLVAFDVYYALAVGISAFVYLFVTIRMAQWSAKTRRQMVNASRHEDAVKNDSMMSYETVKYFNAEQHEFERYRRAVCDFQTTEYYSFLCGAMMSTSQKTVLMTSLLFTCFIAVYQVSTLQQPVGRFVTLLMYMNQLQGPLSYFGAFYVSIQSALINAERMLELFREQPTVTDSPCATPLATCQGMIEFQDVGFSYDERMPVLNGLSFSCQPGSTTALVGESGGGKSTVLRLLFRYYNSKNGKIFVDGHDVKDITIDSLRRHIGVVPQDTMLFNETLMYNLKYAKPDACDEDVHRACRMADIHTKIESFPDGYNTKVGERGLRLSGGERQRLAIARTILKNPQIILLDEATSALDTQTEEHVQQSLSALSNGRTTLVIAHRLSTIKSADRILFLDNGQVAESGTHEQLVNMKGRYARMWRRQNGENKS